MGGVGNFDRSVHSSARGVCTCERRTDRPSAAAVSRSCAVSFKQWKLGGWSSRALAAKVPPSLSQRPICLRSCASLLVAGLGKSVGELAFMFRRGLVVRLTGLDPAHRACALVLVVPTEGGFEGMQHLVKCAVDSGINSRCVICDELWL